jgi:hypothetical protein
MQGDSKHLRPVFFSKGPSKTIVFLLHLSYSFPCCLCRKGLGIPKNHAFFNFFIRCFFKKDSFFSKIRKFLKGFLRLKSGFSWGLNGPLSFQYRNKMGFLCVI